MALSPVVRGGLSTTVLGIRVPFPRTLRFYPSLCSDCSFQDVLRCPELTTAACLPSPLRIAVGMGCRPIETGAANALALDTPPAVRGPPTLRSLPRATVYRLALPTRLRHRSSSTARFRYSEDPRTLASIPIRRQRLPHPNSARTDTPQGRGVCIRRQIGRGLVAG
jgi:hypothetical protein